MMKDDEARFCRINHIKHVIFAPALYQNIEMTSVHLTQPSDRLAKRNRCGWGGEARWLGLQIPIKTFIGFQLFNTGLELPPAGVTHMHNIRPSKY